jgi:alpha-glucosidase
LITDSNIYAYQRKTADKQGIVIANFSDQKTEFTLPKTVWRKVLTNESSEVEDGVVKLGPWGCCALESN